MTIRPADGIASFEVLLVSGMSGAGRSSAARALEDIGWFVIDNLPPRMLAATLELMVERSDTDRVAVVDRKKGRTTNIAKLMTAAGYPPTAYVQSRISGDGKVVLALTPTGTSPMTMRAYVAVTGW